MKKGHIYAYYGVGKGKTTLAIGQGMRVLGDENTVVMVQFLDSSDSKEFLILNRLEPDFRVFKFGKYPEGVNELTDEQEKELVNDISTGINMVKKFVETGESDMLILDGVMDAVSRGYVDENVLCEILSKKETYTDIILTGNSASEKLLSLADYVYCIKTEKYTENE